MPVVRRGSKRSSQGSRKQSGACVRRVFQSLLRGVLRREAASRAGSRSERQDIGETWCRRSHPVTTRPASHENSSPARRLRTTLFRLEKLLFRGTKVSYSSRMAMNLSTPVM